MSLYALTIPIFPFEVLESDTLSLDVLAYACA